MNPAVFNIETLNAISASLFAYADTISLATSPRVICLAARATDKLASLRFRVARDCGDGLDARSGRDCERTLRCCGRRGVITVPALHKIGPALVLGFSRHSVVQLHRGDWLMSAVCPPCDDGQRST
jgi:hypothetical protein